MYESHVTVSGLSCEEFREICRQIKVKAVVIEGDTGSDSKQQMMTSWFHKDYDTAIGEMQFVACVFGEHVVRCKIELVMGKRTALPREYLYREFHLKYQVSQEDDEEFVSTVLGCGGHTSTNARKPGFRFATARTPEVMTRLTSGLSAYKFVGAIMECVVYDTNPEMDPHWGVCNDCLIKATSDDLEEVKEWALRDERARTL